MNVIILHSGIYDRKKSGSSSLLFSVYSKYSVICGLRVYDFYKAINIKQNVEANRIGLF